MPATVEDLLRTLAPQVLGVLARRTGDFADAEDAVQESLIAAATAWPRDGLPDEPAAWLARVAYRRFVDAHRSNEARRRREALVAVHDPGPPPPVENSDDTLTCMFLCCLPSLSPALSIPLTLRAVGGLTTQEIAAAFLVPLPTMAQRISRAKARIRATQAPFAGPGPDELPQRLAAVLHVLYLIFNEGYAATSGADLARTALSDRAVALTRAVQRARPDDPEVAGLLALMLLTDARRPARTTADGQIVPLAEQDRTRWNRTLITEGLELLTPALGAAPLGEYRLQAAVAALHDEAPTHAATRWPDIATLYERLERLTGNPMVRVNRALALGSAGAVAEALATLDEVDPAVADHHRVHAARGHLLELDGRPADAAAAFRDAAARATNSRERDHLILRAATVTSGVVRGLRSAP